MPPEIPDLPKLAAALASEEVDYVLIGGLALILQGGDRFTFDADIAIAFTRENISRVVRALAPLHPRPLRLAPGAAWVWDEFCVRAPWSLFQTDAGRLDLILRLPGADSYAGVYERSRLLVIEGATVRVATLEDLKAMKSVSERDRDRSDVHMIDALLKLRDSR
ncbi:hypothetical protein BH11ARM2_BH11ARM2_26010 [soil metagenome]